MQINIPVNHNYYEEKPLIKDDLKSEFGVRSNKVEKELFSSVHTLTTKSKKLKQLKIFGFKDQKNKLEDEESLILKLYSTEEENKEKKYIVQTGLFAGVIYHKGYKFNITTKYGDTFLKRMLNFVNDIYIDNEDISATKSDNKNSFLHIIAYLFIQSLEKSSVLGLPQEYVVKRQRSSKVRGKIDLNSYLKTDIPFRGKLTTTYREQVFVQEILDVIFLALRKLESTFGRDINKKVFGIHQLLKQNYSGRFATIETINKAKNHRVLYNPMFESFKKVLEYAEIILLDNELNTNKSDSLSTTGFLFDISQLFEVYLEKLLNHNFKNWSVTSQEELNLYKGMYYKRNMYPDIVMKHKESDKIIVFDAKFKDILLNYNKLDRSDFYQIHTYIQYYEPNIILGGLIYPLSKPLVISKAHSETLFGKLSNNNTEFIVDGINVNNTMNMNELIDNERYFLSRIENIMNGKIEMKIEQTAYNKV